jgi:release factor glutamine methyltransferase
MSVSSSPATRSTVIARLRAAGCVFAEDEARMLIAAAPTAADLETMVERRVDGLPLEHVLGWAEFCGLRIEIDPGVFVPRRRTEFLVAQAVDLGRDTADGRRPVIVDLCCGSGAVGAALGAALGEVELHAVDIDPVAVACARRNLAATGARVYAGDLFAPLPPMLRDRIDVVVAITPYVPTGAIRLLPPEARDHEPRTALDGGLDGLDLARRLIADAPSWLAPGGHLVIETSDGQAPLAVGALVRAGLLARIATADDLSSTVVIGTRPTAANGAARDGTHRR